MCVLGIARRWQSARDILHRPGEKDLRQWMINLPDQDLAYLPQSTERFDDYVRAVSWAQDYALANRNLMMRNIIVPCRAREGFRPSKQMWKS